MQVIQIIVHFGMYTHFESTIIMRVLSFKDNLTVQRGIEHTLV